MTAADLNTHTQATKPYYGWYIAITLAVTETILWGIMYYSFSVFLTPMEAELNWSRTELTGGFSLMLLVMGLTAFPVGAWVDRHGARALMTVGAAASAVMVMLWAFVTTRPMFYLVWAGIGVSSAMVLYEPAFGVIARWFVKRRSAALSIVTFAAGLASTIFIPLCDALLNRFGWRTAVLILGIFIAVITVPLHGLVLRRRPSDLGYLPDGDLLEVTQDAPAATGIAVAQVVRTRFFWMLTGAFCLSVFAAGAIRLHFIPFLLSVGIEPTLAAFASGSIGIMQVVGRVFFAPLDSRFSAHAITFGVFGLEALAIVILLLNPTLLGAGIFIIGFGMAVGVKTLTRPSILIEQYGTAHYGRISSIMAIALTLAGTSAPVIAGWLYDQSGSYNAVLWLIVLLAGASVAVIALSKPAQPLTAVSAAER